MSNLWWKVVIRKYQTALPQFFPELDETTGWEGWKPVQQVSAQPKEYTKDYLQGDYPDEFWSIVGNDPEDTKGHGGSRHRVDKDGNYVMVGVRGDSPVGDLPKRGPYRPRKGRKNYPQDYGVRVTQKKDMPSRRNIVVKPMNVKKEAKSPAAIEHKRKYETQYESSPARKKYRRELERERRKRGVAGKGGKDMSHTKTGKIVPEDPHANRARSHPSVGSTLKMVVVEAPRILKDATGDDRQQHESLEDYQHRTMHGYPCRFCNSGRIAQYNAWFNEPRCMECIEQRVDELMPSLDEMNRQVNQPQFDANFQDINTGEPMEITMQLLKAPQMNLSGQSAECELCGAMMNAQEVSVSNQQMGASVCTACLLQEQKRINQEADDAMMYHGEPMDIAMRLLKEQTQLFVQGQKNLYGQPTFLPTDFDAMQKRREAELKRLKEREAREEQRRKNAIGFATLPLENPE